MDSLRREEAMKTAGRENLNRWATLASKQALGADGQNRFCSMRWAAKQENVQPAEKSFFLTSFVELTKWDLRHDGPAIGAICRRQVSISQC
jgi:hypothetical protein